MGIYQICVSGSAGGETVERGAKLAEAVGASLAKAGHSLLTGATTGLPEIAASSYKAQGGVSSLGLSPAASKVEHVLKYRLPTKPYDTILYTGLNYVGRDSLLITSADAVISLGGRLGTLHEFTIAMETETPIGLLHGAGGISDEIPQLLNVLPNASPELIIFETDADVLVAKMTTMLDDLHKPYRDIYNTQS